MVVGSESVCTRLYYVYEYEYALSSRTQAKIRDGVCHGGDGRCLLQTSADNAPCATNASCHGHVLLSLSRITLAPRRRKLQSSAPRPREPTRGTCPDSSGVSRLPHPSVAVHPSLQYNSKSLTVAFIIKCDYTSSSMFLVQRLNYPSRSLVQRLAEILHAVRQRCRRILADEILVDEKRVRTITCDG